MSEDCLHIGKLTKVNTPNGMEWTCHEILKGEGFSSYSYESHQEALMNLLSGKYFIREEILYKVDREDVDIFDNIAIAKNVVKDGTIEFILKYYNGATCFEEMLNEALDKLRIDDE